MSGLPGMLPSLPVDEFSRMRDFLKANHAGSCSPHPEKLEFGSCYDSRLIELIDFGFGGERASKSFYFDTLARFVEDADRETVTKGITAHAPLARKGPRSGAALRISPIGCNLSQRCHCGVLFCVILLRLRSLTRVIL
jgi:hypothetical protein